MDQQHPIPQPISSYQFRLVGDMTLKQFFQLAGGAMVSLLFYAAALPAFIKWPLVFFFFLLGAAMAFLPFQDRPLERWIFAFFRSVYSPTVYLWKRTDKPLNFFKEDIQVPKEAGTVAPHGEIVLEEYLNSLPEQKAPSQSNLDQIEVNILKRITDMLGSGANILSQAASLHLPTTKKEEAQAPAVPEKPKEMEIPSNAPVAVASKGFRPQIVVEEDAAVDENANKVPIQTTVVSPMFGDKTTSSGQSVQFSIDAAPPNPPIVPNAIVGQVMDPDSKIVEGAILEIRDLAGRPVRALRSNKLGHFMIVTSLQNGQYEIFIEKEGLMFQPISFIAEGETIPPIAIRATSRIQPQLPTQNPITVQPVVTQA